MVRDCSLGVVEGKSAYRDSNTLEAVFFVQGHHDSVWSVAWSPDGSMLASGTGDGTLTIWEASTGDGYFVLRERRFPKRQILGSEQ